MRALTPDVTYLGVGDDGRQVVIKKLDTDCLLGAKLHPSIGERLNRVRELAHGRLDTAGGPSFKALPVIVIAPLASVRDLGPSAWLWMARSSALVALWLA